MQPYPFLSDTTLTMQNAYEEYPMQFPINDLLAILSFGRVFILAKTALFFTPYMSNRGDFGLI